MTSLTLENVLRRDRWIVALALGAIVALSWIYILSLILQMGHSGGGCIVGCSPSHFQLASLAAPAIAPPAPAPAPPEPEPD